MRRRAAAVLVLLTGSFWACSSPPPRRAIELDHAPPDFALAATVYSAADAEDAARVRRPMRPSRYIVEPDGVLRAAIGPGADETTYPPRTRQLTRRQIEQLWRLVRDSGLLDPGSIARVGSSQTPLARDRASTVIYVAYDGQREFLWIDLERGGSESAAGLAIVDRLAAFAWVER